MLTALHEKKRVQLVLGLLIGIAFGFLLDRGGVTDYTIILNQLLLRDFRVFKIMCTAAITGMIGLYILSPLGYVEFHPKSCRVRGIIIGGLIFGIGFALLGYCPGTAAGAVGTGSIHAMFGVVGIMIGAGIFASVYPKVRAFITKGDRGAVTLPEVFDVNPWAVILPLSLILIVFMYLLEINGL